MDDAPRTLVIGGGSTGTAIARDLAMRGIDVELVDRGSLAAGTTGRMHGLLHSGARYVESDPKTAGHCLVENRTIRSIAPHCVEETGGLFVQTHADDEAYFERKLAACRDAGIRTAVIDPDAARAAQPGLDRGIERAFSVPDAAIDPVRFSAANALAAASRGARIRTHTGVVDLIREDGRVVGAVVEPAGGARDGAEPIRTDFVVNAAGAWAGRVAGKAGLAVELRLSRGAMVALDGRPVDTVVNRCRPPTDGDIAVPVADTVVLGTTAVEVSDPDDVTGDRAEVELVIDELAEVVPAAAELPVKRAYWGVRPLPEPVAVAASREVSRDFRIVDHPTRDGVDGLLSIVGGKVTTARLMGERVADRVCEALGVSARCSTAETDLPGRDDPERLEGFMATVGLEPAIDWPAGG